MNRWIKRLLPGVLVVLAAAWFALPIVGNHIVLPGMLQGKPDGLLRPGPGFELVSFATRGGIPITAEFAPAETNDGHPLPDPENRPTLLYFYGAQRTLATPPSQSQIRYFRTMGVNILMPDFPGYGMSGGSPSEPGFSAAADAAYDYLAGRLGGAPGRILVGGSSRGAATAIDLASRRPVLGLVSMSGFTRMADIGYRYFPLAPHWLVRRLFASVPLDNAAAIRRVSCPILIIHGTVDPRVPFPMADELAAAAGGPVTRITVPGAGHDDIGKVGGTKLWTGIRDWLAARGRLSGS
jgi:pimeloyl-ACP methyl ester carboxylesterase